MDRFSYSRNGNNGLVDRKCQVHVHVVGVETRGKHVFYQIRATNVATRQSWDVSRRFSEFLKVRNALLAYFKEREGSKCPGCVNYEKVIRLFEFPRKHVFTSVSPQVLNYRKAALKNFVALLASHTFTEKPKCPTCSGQAFTLVQDFLTQELKAAPASGTVHGPDDVAVSTDAIRESIDVKKFMGTQHPVSKLRPVDSNGKFTTVAAVRKKQQPRAAAGPQKPRINAKHAAGEDSDDLPSPPHSSTGSSSGSFGSMSSPTAVPVPVARHPQAKAANTQAIEDDDQVEDDGEGSFVSFTAPTRQKRTSSRASRNSARRSRNKSITAATVVIKKKSEKKRLNFTRRRGSSAAGSQRRHSMESTHGEDEDEEINMDFLKNVSISA
ncbi:Membrane protein [Globisporangium polare]